MFLQHIYYRYTDQGTDEFAEYLNDKTFDSSHIEQTKEQNHLLPVRVESGNHKMLSTKQFGPN